MSQPKQKHIALAAIALLVTTLGVLVVPALLGGDDAMVTWDTADETEVVVEAPPAATPDADPGVDGEPGRTDLSGHGGAAAEPVAGERLEAILRGRVVDAFAAPVAGARVFLDFARGGRGRGEDRQRRVPDPVVTGADGTFAFRGQVFRNLRVALQVIHPDHANAAFDRSLGDVTAEVQLGDLVLTSGGRVIGRVTDLQGSPIPGASIGLLPANDNRLRWVRNRDEMTPPAVTDRNGWYRFEHTPPGDWRVSATARNHEVGQSAEFTAVDDQQTDVPDLQLGPGFEVVGFVRDVGGRPIAEAAIHLRPQRGGRSYRTATDAQGRFGLEHLPGTAMSLQVERRGYLRHEQRDLDPTQPTGPWSITLQDGLRIAGMVRDGRTGRPVTSFAVRTQRIADLPREADAAAAQAQAQGPRRNESRPTAPAASQGPTFEPPTDLGRPEPRPDGRFAATGLEEGLYRVSVQSPDHMQWRSGTLELRAGAPPAELQIALEAGLAVSGQITDRTGRPLAQAQVDLRRLREDGGERPTGNGPPGRVNRESSAARTRADAQGRFALRHLPPGSYLVAATAENHDAGRTEPFALQQTDVGGIVLALDALGALTGRITNAAALVGREVRVTALPTDRPFEPWRMGNGGRGMLAQMEPDGTYRIDGLRPGPHHVRAFVGSAGDLFRDLGPLLGSGQTLPTDVTIAPGEVATLDLVATLPQRGGVRGTVTANGAPAAGFRVELRPVAGTAEPGRFGRQGDGTDAEGRYAIDNVDAGLHELLVLSGRNGSELHRQQVAITADFTATVDLTVAVGTIRGTVRVPDGAPAATGNVQLLPGVTELPADLAAFRRSHRIANARVADGRFVSEALPPGQYLLLLQVRGHGQVTQAAFVGGGQDVQVELDAGPVQQGGTGAPRTSPPPDERRAGRGPR